jgi:hypothetical protein
MGSPQGFGGPPPDYANPNPNMGYGNPAPGGYGNPAYGASPGYGANPGYGQGAMQQYGGAGGAGGGGGAMVAPGVHGQKGAVRNGLMVLLYGMGTCGIYQMIWFISVCGEMKEYLQRDEPNWLKIMGLSIVTCGLYGLYWQFSRLGLLIQEMQQRAGLPNPQNPGIMLLIPYYNVMVMQEELNKVWQSPG